MAEPLDVIFLSSSPSGDPGLRPLTPLLDALERRSVRGRVISTALVPGQRGDPRHVAFPELAAFWTRPIGIRRLARAEEFRNTRVIHVLHESMFKVGIALADLGRLPYVQNLENLPLPGGGVRLHRRWCRGLIVPTAEHALALAGEFGVPETSLHVVPPGFVARPDARRREPGTIAVVGTAVPPGDGEALLEFLRAARRVLDQGEDVEVLIGNQDGALSDIRRASRAEGLADRVSLVDASFLDERFWAVLDVYCHPATTLGSIRNLLRAMAEGIPCLATGIGGIDRLFEDGRSGILLPPDEPEAMAGLVLDLIHDPDRAMDLGRAGQAVIRRTFSLQAEADRLAGLYRSIS